MRQSISLPEPAIRPSIWTRFRNGWNRLSVEIRDRVQSRFKELHEVFVPVSMALLTNYDDAYLGIGPAPKES